MSLKCVLIYDYNELKNFLTFSYYQLPLLHYIRYRGIYIPLNLKKCNFLPTYNQKSVVFYPPKMPLNVGIIMFLGGNLLLSINELTFIPLFLNKMNIFKSRSLVNNFKYNPRCKISFITEPTFVIVYCSICTRCIPTCVG